MARLVRSKPALYVLALLLLLLVFALEQRPGAVIASRASQLSDFYYGFNRHQPPAELVFIEVENDSVRQFGRWPWRRSILAEGLQRLQQAEVIGLDMLFSEPTWHTQDDALELALDGLPVIGGVFLNGPAASLLDEQAWGELAGSALLGSSGEGLLRSERLELPLPRFRQVMPVLAALNISPDADQLFRHYPLAFAVNDLVLPNMATQMWRYAFGEELQLQPGQARLGDKLLWSDNSGRQRLNFYPEQGWQRISFARVMADDWQPEILQGKLVLFGISEAGVTDIRATPVGQLPGPLLHLTQLANWLDGSQIKPVGAWQMLVLLVLSWLLALLVWQLAQPWWRLLGWLVLGLGWLALGVLCYVYLSLWVEVFYPLLLLLLWLVVGEAWLFRLNRAETAYLRNAFASYVAPTLVAKLVRQGQELHLGGQKQTVTAMFTDLRGFTCTSESMDSEQLVQHLNQYFGLMINELHSYHGTLDKLIGDAIMALFNAPLADHDHAYHACLAAAGMLRALEQFNRRWPEGDRRQLRMGVGINTGEAIVGNIGAAGRFNYTAIGDTVNIAARLESMTKEVNENWQQAHCCLSADVLIGEQTYLAVRDRLPCYPAGDLVLKGKSASLPAWVLDWRNCHQHR